MIKTILFFVLISTLFSCSNRTEEKSKSFNKLNRINYAKTIEIFEEDEFVRVHILNPETKTTIKYFLSAKKDLQLPEGYIFIQTPIKSIITLSSTHIGMLSKIDAIEKIKGVSNKKFIHNSELRKRIDSGKVKDFGDEINISFESIVKSKAQILMYSGFGSEFAHTEQLMKLGTICIANYDWKENHPLGKAEWIKFFGYLTGKEKQAENYFKSIVKEYNSLVELAKKSKEKPSVFSGNIYGEIWNTPAGESFYAKLFKDANCNYAYADSKGVGSLELSFEKVLTDNVNTDFWFNPGYFPLSEILKINPKMAYFKSVQMKNVYCYSPTMDLYWEMGAVEPHHVLEDLMKILHPELFKNKKLYFYKNIGI